VNFGAMSVEANVADVPIGEGGLPPPGGGVPPEVGEEYQAYNDLRYQYPLNPLNFTALNRVRLMTEMPNFDGNTSPLHEVSHPHHESPLYRTGGTNLEEEGAEIMLKSLGDEVGINTTGPTAPADTVIGGSLFVRIFGDGSLIWEGQIIDQEMYRLPSGYKARRWQFEFVGTVNLKSFKIAETGAELAQI
jgi:hypothetical protein